MFMKRDLQQHTVKSTSQNVIRGAVVKKSDMTIVKHMLFETRVSNTRRKMTLLNDKHPKSYFEFTANTFPSSTSQKYDFEFTANTFLSSNSQKSDLNSRQTPFRAQKSKNM